MNSYNTDDLIEDILLLGHIPTGNNTFTNDTLLRLANMELQTPIIKQILSTRGGYYLTYEDQDPVATGLYSIPSDAIAGGLAQVEIVQNESVIPVNVIESHEQFSTLAPSSSTYGYYMRGNYVQVLPTDTNGTLRFWYYKRPSQLIQTTQAAQVSAIAGATITVSTLPSTILVDSVVDVLGDQPPFNILGNELTVTDITGTDLTLSEEVAGLTVGDWVALTDQTPIPQIPVEYRVVLAQRVVCKIYELQNYGDKLKAAQMKLAEYEKDTLNLITPRVKTQTKVIFPSGGFLRGRSYR